jgi:HEAT repeat protein
MSGKRIRLLLAIAFVSVIFAQKAEIESLLPEISGYDYGQDREPLARFSKLIERSRNSARALEQIETALLQLLRSRTATPASKDFALRQLSLIATGKSVPLLKGMLTTPETAEMARYALTRIPGSAANDALIKVLPEASGNVRIGIINSLGHRRARKAVPSLGPLLLSGDLAVAEAVAAALSDIGDQAALDALASARRKATGRTRESITHAYLRCAGRTENKAAAAKVYRELIGPREPDRIRIAALGALSSVDRSAAVPILLNELNSGSYATEAAAIRLLSEIPDPKITAGLVQQFSKLKQASQIVMLAALADRGDVSAMPVFVASLRNPGLRAAALSGLAKIGDASSVSLLAEAAANGEGAEREAARASLYALRGPVIDKAIVAGLASSTGKTKVELIMAAGERDAREASSLLIEAVEEKDPQIHRESLRALRNVARSEHIPALLQMLVKATTASDRREAAQALASVLKRSETAGVNTVIATYKTTGEMPARLALIDVFGQTSSDEALPVLREGLKDASPEIARAAILALSEWTRPAPMDDLLSAARSSTSPTLQVLALRGYLKLIALPSQRSAAESAGKLSEAMHLAKQPAEKRTILSLLPAFPSKESLEIAEAATQDQTVGTEAKVAVDRINSLLKFQ